MDELYRKEIGELERAMNELDAGEQGDGMGEASGYDENWVGRCLELPRIYALAELGLGMDRFMAELGKIKKCKLKEE